MCRPVAGPSLEMVKSRPCSGPLVDEFRRVASNKAPNDRRKFVEVFEGETSLRCLEGHRIGDYVGHMSVPINGTTAGISHGPLIDNNETVTTTVVRGGWEMWQGSESPLNQPMHCALRFTRESKGAVAQTDHHGITTRLQAPREETRVAVLCGEEVSHRL